MISSSAISQSVIAQPSGPVGMGSLPPQLLDVRNQKQWFIEFGADLSTDLPPGGTLPGPDGTGGGLQTSPPGVTYNYGAQKIYAPRWNVDLNDIRMKNQVDLSRFYPIYRVAIESAYIFRDYSRVPDAATFTTNPNRFNTPEPVYLLSDELTKDSDGRYFCRFGTDQLQTAISQVAFQTFEFNLPSNIGFTFPACLDSLPDNRGAYYANSPRISGTRDLSTGSPMTLPYYTNQFISKFNIRFSVTCQYYINVKSVYTPATYAAAALGVDVAAEEDDDNNMRKLLREVITEELIPLLQPAGFNLKSNPVPSRSGLALGLDKAMTNHESQSAGMPPPPPPKPPLKSMASLPVYSGEGVATSAGGEAPAPGGGGSAGGSSSVDPNVIAEQASQHVNLMLTNARAAYLNQHPDAPSMLSTVIDRLTSLATTVGMSYAMMAGFAGAAAGIGAEMAAVEGEALAGSEMASVAGGVESEAAAGSTSTASRIPMRSEDRYTNSQTYEGNESTAITRASASSSAASGGTEATVPLPTARPLSYASVSALPPTNPLRIKIDAWNERASMGIAPTANEVQNFIDNDIPQIVLGGSASRAAGAGVMRTGMLSGAEKDIVGVGQNQYARSYLKSDISGIDSEMSSRGGVGGYGFKPMSEGSGVSGSEGGYIDQHDGILPGIRDMSRQPFAPASDVSVPSGVSASVAQTAGRRVLVNDDIYSATPSEAPSKEVTGSLLPQGAATPAGQAAGDLNEPLTRRVMAKKAQAHPRNVLPTGLAGRHTPFDATTGADIDPLSGELKAMQVGSDQRISRDAFLRHLDMPIREGEADYELAETPGPLRNVVTTSRRLAQEYLDRLGRKPTAGERTRILQSLQGKGAMGLHTGVEQFMDSLPAYELPRRNFGRKKRGS